MTQHERIAIRSTKEDPTDIRDVNFQRRWGRSEGEDRTCKLDFAELSRFYEGITGVHSREGEIFNILHASNAP